ncbi:MAG TPA: hypothetical protein VGT05_03395 [Patescibacteria group bacterium]|nr:hypothetical protein [Patescibacteria group bacterium]
MKKKLGIVLLIIILIVLGIEAYYFSRNNMLQYDEDAISQTLVQKSKIPLNQLRITFIQDPTVFHGLYATGQVSSAKEIRGGNTWYAAKVEGKWIIVVISQGPLSCDQVKTYKLPENVINTCID